MATTSTPIGPDYAHLTAPTYANMRKTSIYGGSNEIQHNIIAKMVLGLLDGPMKAARRQLAPAEGHKGGGNDRCKRRQLRNLAS